MDDDSIRDQCIILAQADKTPVPVWYNMPLVELSKWIAAHNRVFEQAHSEH